MSSDDETKARKRTAQALHGLAKSYRQTAKALEESAVQSKKAAEATAAEAQLLPPEDRPYKAQEARIRGDLAKTLLKEAAVKERVGERVDGQAATEEKKIERG
jgi:hypothetical protein